MSQGVGDAPSDGVLRLEPLDANLNGYLEDTIVVDWQTPIVFERSRSLVAGLGDVEARLRAAFTFVRDEIAHSFDIETDELTCNASEVLRAGHGLCYAKSHLLVALIRSFGVPAGFGFQRLRSDGPDSAFVLHGFVGVRLPETGRWVPLDARGDNETLSTVFDLDTPSLAFVPDPALGEETLPGVHSKPLRHVVGMLSRGGTLTRVRRTLPGEV